MESMNTHACMSKDTHAQCNAHQCPANSLSSRDLRRTFLGYYVKLKFSVFPSDWSKMPKDQMVPACERSLISLSAFAKKHIFKSSCTLIPAKLFPPSHLKTHNRFGFLLHALCWRTRKWSQFIMGLMQLYVVLIMIMEHECHEQWKLKILPCITVAAYRSEVYSRQ